MPQFEMTPSHPDSALNIPDGFKPRFFGDGFISVNGPLYTRRTDTGMQMGLRVEPRHCNPMGNLHGGMMATFCDMLLPMSAMVMDKTLAGHFLPTINLQVDYLGPSPLGTWVQGEAQILRVTRSMVFMQGLVHADGAPAARVSGIFKIGGAFAGFQPLGAANT
jgi:uncharacterized protein (TIGR00369 family)